MPRARSTDVYEVVKVGTEWCLRFRESKRPVAWSKTDSAPFRAYCAEAEESAQKDLAQDP